MVSMTVVIVDATGHALDSYVGIPIEAGQVVPMPGDLTTFKLKRYRVMQREVPILGFAQVVTLHLMEA